MEATEFDSEVVSDLRGCSEAQNGQKLNRMILPQNRMAITPSEEYSLVAVIIILAVEIIPAVEI